MGQRVIEIYKSKGKQKRKESRTCSNAAQFNNSNWPSKISRRKK